MLDKMAAREWRAKRPFSCYGEAKEERRVVEDKKPEDPAFFY
jgi:hypothetical protein